MKMAARHLTNEAVASKWDDALAYKAECDRREAERNQPQVGIITKALDALRTKGPTIDLTLVEVALLMGLGFIAGPVLVWVAA